MHRAPKGSVSRFERPWEDSPSLMKHHRNLPRLPLVFRENNTGSAMFKFIARTVSCVTNEPPHFLCYSLQAILWSSNHTGPPWQSSLALWIQSSWLLSPTQIRPFLLNLFLGCFLWLTNEHWHPRLQSVWIWKEHRRRFLQRHSVPSASNAKQAAEYPLQNDLSSLASVWPTPACSSANFPF